jgi:hypothetical protein
MTYRIVETFGRQTILAVIHHHEQLIHEIAPHEFILVELMGVLHIAAAQDSSQFIYL